MSRYKIKQFASFVNRMTSLFTVRPAAPQDCEATTTPDPPPLLSAFQTSLAMVSPVSLRVRCRSGFDGGLPQTFHMVVRAGEGEHPWRNVVKVGTIASTINT